MFFALIRVDIVGFGKKNENQRQGFVSVSRNVQYSQKVKEASCRYSCSSKDKAKSLQEPVLES
jgi:hypothetical protein